MKHKIRFVGITPYIGIGLGFTFDKQAVSILLPFVVLEFKREWR